MSSILRVRDENGNIIEIPALKGDKGDPYKLTEADKTSIKDEVVAEIDVPTKTSELENDSGFVTAEYVTAAINGSLDEIEAMIDESGVLDE